MEEKDVPNLKKTFLSGLHFLIPIFVLIYLLTYLRLTASYSIFYATIAKAKAKKYFPPPAVSRRAPNKTNKYIKSTETPMGIPNIASWSNH